MSDSVWTQFLWLKAATLGKKMTLAYCTKEKWRERFKILFIVLLPNNNSYPRNMLLMDACLHINVLFSEDIWDTKDLSSSAAYWPDSADQPFQEKKQRGECGRQTSVTTSCNFPSIPPLSVSSSTLWVFLYLLLYMSEHCWGHFCGAFQEKPLREAAPQGLGTGSRPASRVNI